jgi:hypothetical protein
MQHIDGKELHNIQKTVHMLTQNDVFKNPMSVKTNFSIHKWFLDYVAVCF